MLERQVVIRNPIGTSAYRRRSAMVTAQVMLWRIAFVTLLAPVALYAFDESTDSRASNALALVKRYALEAFPQWAAVHLEQACPRSLDELAPWIHQDAIDPWGTPLEMKCGAPIRGVFVQSAGPDRTFETADDITSNTEG